jgi:hypothetical protein
MVSTVALVAVVSLGAADLYAGSPNLGVLPALRASVVLPSDGQDVPTLTLRSPWLERATRLARQRPGVPLARQPQANRGAQASAQGQAGVRETTAEGTPGTAATATAGGGQPATAGGGQAEPGAEPSEEPDLELLRHRARLTRVHRIMGISTLASLVVTEFLGTFLMLNRPTVFGDGTGCQCDLGLGGALTPLHELSAFITVGLYATTGIFALSMPDPEHASVGNDRRARTLRLHKALALVHLGGMILQPILGILSYSPSVFGIQDNAHGDFGRDIRTIHAGVGYVTLAALATAMAVEL